MCWLDSRDSDNTDRLLSHVRGQTYAHILFWYVVLALLVLTALGEEQDKVRAPDLGADGYLTKPFGVDELLARVRAALRRSAWMANRTPATLEMSRYGDIELEPDAISVRCRGEVLKLTQTEFNLLHILMQNAGKVRTHTTILKAVWGRNIARKLNICAFTLGASPQD